MWTDEQYVRAMTKFASKNMLLIHTEMLKHWHSIPPHAQFSCQTSPNSLLWLYTRLIFPLPLQVFLTPSPTQIPYLISVFFSSSTQCVCTASPTSSTHLLISAFPPLHELMANFSVQLISSCPLMWSHHSPSQVWSSWDWKLSTQSRLNAWIRGRRHYGVHPMAPVPHCSKPESKSNLKEKI